MNNKIIAAVCAACVGVAVVAGYSVSAIAADWGPYQVEDRRSGYTFAQPETQAMQQDEFQNPGILWVEQGAELWTQVEGKANKSCASCHGESADSMKGVSARYPAYDADAGKMQTLQHQVNFCREKRMEAEPFKWESEQMLSTVSFIGNQSLGMPMSVKVDGPAAPFFEKGKEFYHQRRGQLDMACKHCHVDNPGMMIRANRLSQGQANGFPTYRLKWQKVGSLHRRFRGCNRNIRATPYKAGSEEYTNLELYVKWRGRGLPVEIPSVRN